MLTTEIKLREVKEQIEKLEKEKIRLEKKLMKESKTFKDKLSVWVCSDNKRHEDWIIDKKEYPNLYAYFEGNMERHRTYDLVAKFDEYIDRYLDGEEIRKDILNCLKEMVKKNIGSFECDW